MTQVPGSGYSYSQINPNSLKSFAWATRAGLPDMSTGLNPKGNAAFRSRMREAFQENSISGNISDVSFSRNADGKFVVNGDHPEKGKIENLLNNDEKLNQIRNDPANAFDFSEKGSSYSNNYDSVYFSEEAKALYEQRAKNGQSAYASSIEDTAQIMEWVNRPVGGDILARLNSGEKLSTNISPLSAGYVADEEVDISKLSYIKSDAIKNLAKTRNWIETEVTALFEKAGIDTSKLSGVQFADSGGKIGVVANQQGISEKDRVKMESILNNPDNAQLAKVMKRYMGEANITGAQLQKATGLNGADWTQVMASGGNLASVNNDGMKALLESDPELASALGSLYNGGTGFLANSQAPGSGEDVKKTVGGLAGAIESVVKGGASSIGLTGKEIESLKNNLSVEVNSDGTYKVGGTNNSKLLSVIDDYVRHYLSGSFGDFLKSGALLNQALGKGDANEGVSFAIAFKDGKPNATIQYGNGEKQAV